MRKRSDSFIGRAREAFLRLEGLRRSSNDGDALERWQDDVEQIMTHEMPRLDVSEEENGGVEAFRVSIDFDGNLRLIDTEGGRPRLSPPGVLLLMGFVREHYAEGFEGHGGWDADV